jgi:hypothetical protein
MILGLILGVVGVIIGIVGWAIGFLFSLAGSAITGVLVVLLIVGAILFSPVLFWLALGIAVVYMIRGARWLERTLKGW